MLMKNAKNSVRFEKEMHWNVGAACIITIKLKPSIQMFNLANKSSD